MKQNQIKNSPFTYFPCGLRISSVYFPTFLIWPTSWKWSLQWSYTEEFNNTHIGINVRNQSFRWLMEISFILKTPVCDMPAKNHMFFSITLKCFLICFFLKNVINAFWLWHANKWKYLILVFYFRPILSEKNELLVQFLSDLSLTADGFIGHYKFRPKKLPTTTALPTTTTVPATSSKSDWLYFIFYKN